MSVNFTEIIAAIATLDNVLSRVAHTDDGIIAITVDPRVFHALVAEARGRPVRGNRLELAGIIVRKDHGLTDATQPEIKKRAG